MGLSFSFTASINTVTQWFNKRRSTAVGVMYIGSGIGGIVIPIVLKALFAAVGFGWAIRILAFIALMIMAISVLLTTDRRKELGLDHSGNPIIGAIKGVDFSRVKEPLYLVYLVACIGNSGPFFLTLNYLVSYATANGWDEGLAYYLPVAYNAASILGRVIGGYLSDRYGRFNIFICANAIAAIAVFVCWIPPTIGHSKGGLFAFAVIGGFTSGSYFQSSPTCLAQISDPKRFSAQFGAFSCVIAIFNFAFLPIGGAIISAGGGGGPGYDKFVILVAVLQFLGLAFSIITRVMLEGFRLTAV
ncbi:hypothetical protein PSN45_003571 [Yamadazyma tenuis]|nr:hypothetical protein PSN45_003571 [Yamadazyma tenuis]